MGLGRIKALAGDFKIGNHHQYVHGKFMMKHDGKFLRETIQSSQIDTIKIATEENVVSVGGAAGWGITGAVLLGPVGLLAGLVLGGKGAETTFICTFKDGRKFIGTGASSVYTQLQKYLLANSFNSAQTSE